VQRCQVPDSDPLDLKLKLAEQILEYSDRNVQVAMEIMVGHSAGTESLLRELTENGKTISALSNRIRERVETDRERELLDAAISPWSRSHAYAESLQSVVDQHKKFDATVATSNIILPLLLDNSCWKAYVHFLRARTVRENGRTEHDLISRTRQLLRAHQEVKSAAAERKRIAERLSQLASIIECSSDAIVIHTLDGLIVSWNRAAETVYGYSASEVLGRPRSLLIPADQTDDLPGIVEKLKSGETINRFETVHIRKGGRPIDVSITISPVKDVSDEVVGAAAIARDISDRKLLEKQLRQAQKMEAIGQLAGGIAHDFNNLLSVINGYCDLLEQELQGNGTAGRNCEQIKKAGERAAGLTRQLLVFSRQQMPEPKVLDLNDVIVDLEKMLRRIIGEDVEFRTSLASNLGLVKADRGQIEQVVMNLVVNARDAMPNGGRLVLETANIVADEKFALRHGLSESGHYVGLSLMDNGIGMDPETQTRIFEPFFTTKEMGKGTGLGLSTVYGVVTQSGGHVEVQSQLGHGTTFHVYLPIIQKSVCVEKPTVCTNTGLRGNETILLVEDEEALRHLTRDILVSRGYTVLEADSPEKAMQIANEHAGPIHLLLTDVVMPRMNGCMLAQRVQASRPEIKVIYMSGYVGFKQSEVLDRHAIVISKPFRSELLLSKLREALNFEPELTLSI
jgi:two-component system, cell cycle sensor histidine kinase and response regulator CckA